MPGQLLGNLRKEIAEEVGFDAQVILPATHDTGSAFLAVPARDDHSLFLSSGTWSLIGRENAFPLCDERSMQANFTNEGGYGKRYRYLKNIMGLWMIQNIRRECPDENGKRYSFPQLIEMAQTEDDFPSRIDVDEDRFLAPHCMYEEVQSACRESGQKVPENLGQVMTVVYHSLAGDYAKAMHEIESLTGEKVSAIHIVGGGSQDMHLNQLCADATGLSVYAGPTEGTALGNLIAQWITSKEISNLAEARRIIAESFEIREVKPQ